jgi:hypothetical protein
MRLAAKRACMWQPSHEILQGPSLIPFAVPQYLDQQRLCLELQRLNWARQLTPEAIHGNATSGES